MSSPSDKTAGVPASEPTGESNGDSNGETTTQATGQTTGAPAVTVVESRGRRRQLPWILGVAGFAVLVLLAYAPLFKLDRLHVQDMYVDQAGYITTARLFADTGRFENGIILPSQILADSYHVHMPGHSTVLALSYLVFGFSVLSTLLPSLIGYVLTTVCAFLIGDRLYGRRAGALSAALVALFPANIVYAYTAMAEMTFTASVALATTVFVYLRPERRTWAPCLLLTVPFLFRESAAFVILPMALMILRERGLLRASLASGATVASLWLVNRWQIASGKVAASLAWVTEGGFNYANAFAKPPEPLSGSEWLAKLGENVDRNLHLLDLAFDKRPGELMPWCLVMLFVLAGLALIAGMTRIRREGFALGAALLLVLLFGLSVALYDVKLHKMMRSAIFAYPLGAVAVAGLFVGHDQARRAAVVRVVGILIGLAALASSVSVTRLGAATLTKNDEQNAKTTADLVRINDLKKVIVAPNAAALYAVENYPVRWSQQPANERTLEAILERYDVGVILTGRTLSLPFLQKHGLTVVSSKSGTQFYMPAADAARLQARLRGE